MKLSPSKKEQVRQKSICAPLSSELRKRYGRRSLSVRKGDTVKIARGDFTGIEGKVSRVDRGRARLFVEGLSREKVSGTSTLVTVHSSKVMITNLNLSDKWRVETLEGTKIETPAKEPEKKEEGE